MRFEEVGSPQYIKIKTLLQYFESANTKIRNVSESQVNSNAGQKSALKFSEFKDFEIN